MINLSLAIIKKELHASGGLEKVTRRLVDEFQNRGIEVTVYSTNSYTPKGFFKFQQLKDFDLWASKEAAKHPVVLSMDRSSFQTHHRAGNGVHAAYLDIRAQTEGRLRFALNPLHRLQLSLEKKTFESPETKAIIVNSHMVKEQILNYYKTPSSKIHVIHNGVEWNELEADFADSILNRKKYATVLGLDPSVFQFLFIGHNFKRKGLDVLLESLALLKNKNFHLSIVGSDKHMSSYKTQARHLDLESKVTFFGAQAVSRPYYLASDCLVIPSTYDPFANVTVEALALGLLVVSSKMNGGHEVLQPHTGTVIENAQNPEEVAAALESAMNHPKEPLLATTIRSSISHLDYSNQLAKICDLCLT